MPPKPVGNDGNNEQVEKMRKEMEALRRENEQLKQQQNKSSSPSKAIQGEGHYDSDGGGGFSD